MDAIEITAIIPTYNRAHLIGRAIESALAQTRPPTQILVVDDGSTDDTQTVCLRFGDRIEYVRQPNGGPSASRNTGIAGARHSWIAFLDSDDFWTPRHLERMAAAIAQTGGAAQLYFGDMQMPEEEGGGTLWSRIGFSPPASVHFVEDATAWMLLKRQPVMLQTSVIKRTALMAAGGLSSRLRLVHDSFLFCQLGVGAAACAVDGVACVQTADDASLVRVTGAIPLGSEGNVAEGLLMWRDVLSLRSLPAKYRRLVLYNYAASHFALARLKWFSARRLAAVRHLLLTAVASPALVLWFLRHGTTQGYETLLRAGCSQSVEPRS